MHIAFQNQGNETLMKIKNKSLRLLVLILINSFTFIIVTVIVGYSKYLFPPGNYGGIFGLVRYGIPIFLWIAIFKWSKSNL